MNIKVALAGNPNSGKTTLFNTLTGSNQYVGNWPGVTVEKKEGRLKGNKDVNIVDLPGIYSLSPYTLEEVVTRDFLINEKPDVIINLVDATNIERNLYLTTQLAELGIPMVIALNMIDLLRKPGDTINIEKLSKEIGCEIVEVSALRGTGVMEVANKAIKIAKSQKAMQPIHKFGAEVEFALSQISDFIKNREDIAPELIRWYTIKLFERDSKVLEKLQLSKNDLEKIEKIISDIEKKFDDDAESIITNERYEFIEKVVKIAVKKKSPGMTTSDKIDRIVTNRVLALPIFALVVFIIYF
ncbi:MAG TPA: ferrous iron transporter B, partial [Clostridiales bacterium]|nr:ferrous iron transporter B [Clostridiales bacterium]